MNEVDFRSFASCILNLQCRAGPSDPMLFNPIRYQFMAVGQIPCYNEDRP